MLLGQLLLMVGRVCVLGMVLGVTTEVWGELSVIVYVALRCAVGVVSSKGCVLCALRALLRGGAVEVPCLAVG